MPVEWILKDMLITQQLAFYFGNCVYFCFDERNEGLCVNILGKITPLATAFLLCK